LPQIEELEHILKPLLGHFQPQARARSEPALLICKQLGILSLKVSDALLSFGASLWESLKNKLAISQVFTHQLERGSVSHVFHCCFDITI
tara:strand:+ start:645 stop:914 length:270 start_codon:yes stop_codon:yes gene_type:complete